MKSRIFLQQRVACAMGFLVAAAPFSRSQSPVGAGPYYHFDLVAKVGTPMDTGETVSNNHNPTDPISDAIPDHFSMNDGGDILALYKVAVADKSVFQYAVAPYDHFVLNAIKGGGNGVGGISDNGAIILGNNIYPAGSSKTAPSGFITQPILDAFGFAKEWSPPVIPFESMISRNGTMFFQALDQRLFDGREGYGYYRVIGVGGPSSISRIYPLQIIPSISTNAIATCVAGDNRRLLISEYRDDFHSLSVLDSSGTTRLLDAFPIENINPAMGLNPGMTGDGEFMAYTVAGRGGEDFIMVGQTGTGQPFSQPQAAFSTRNVIGITAAGNPIRMQGIPLTPISIIRHDKGDDGNIEGDVLWLTFMATPTEASPENPRAPGKPLLFRQTQGVWSLRVDIQRALDGNLQLNASGPIAVVQEGDTFEGREILELQLSQSLARGTKDSNGSDRVPGRHDHVIAFRLRTSQGLALLRATHFDADEDGLPDHWEIAGGGVDGDRDGVPDLVLSRFGADPRHKDLFLEMDWLPARTTGYPGGWENRPSTRSLFYLAEMFANAPVDNPDGIPGIRLRIDAGSGTDAEGLILTNGMGTTTTADLQGGDEVRLSGTRPDVIRLGNDAVGTFGAFEVASMDEVKAAYFGSREKSAREFAFRYAVLGDFQDVMQDLPLPGGDVVYATVAGISGNTITLALSQPLEESRADILFRHRWMGLASGPAAGQLSRMNPLLSQNYQYNTAGNVISYKAILAGPALSPSPAAGDLVYFFSGNTGLAEGFMRDVMDPAAGPSNAHRLGGNDLQLSMANFAAPLSPALRQQLVGRTLAHELGHTLGLAHGGRETLCQYHGDIHWSLMSYSHQLRVNGTDLIRTGEGACGTPLAIVLPPLALTAQTTPPGVVNSYSRGTDPMGFNEWAYARLETWSVPWYLGNSKLRYAGALPPLHPADEPGPADHLDFATLDPTGPVLTWQLPAAPVRSVPNSVLTVEFTATDNVGVASVSVAYDADGNGQAQGAGEVLVPADLGGNRYRAVFTTTGSTGNREVIVTALDAAGNRSVLNPRLLVGTGALPDTSPPYITANRPAQDGLLPSSGLVPVEFQSGDGSFVGGLLRAVVRFDVNGDGMIDPVTEEFPSVTAQSTQAGSRIAWLPAVSGASGIRSLQFIAEDRWFNRATLNINVTVQPQDLAAPALVWVTGPADGAAVDYGGITYNMQVTATDSGGIKQLSWVLDANGDGAIEQVFSGERVRYFQNGSANSVTQAMTLQTLLSGPPGVRTLFVTATDNAGNVASLSRTLVLTDQTPPVIRVTAPGSGDPVRLGSPLAITGTAVDNNRILLLRASGDLDGDGIVEPNEILEATPAVTTGAFTINFPALSGPGGMRVVRVEATDPSLNQSVSVTNIAVNAGGMLVFTPQSGERWQAGSSVVVSVELTPSAATDRTVRFQFDVNGDGDLTDPGEDQLANVFSDAVLAPLPRAVAVFGSLAGPGGMRVLTARENIEGSTAVSSPISVEALPVSGISDRIGHIPGTTPLLAAEGDGDSIPTPVGRLGNIVFFTAQSPREGIELWRTDGTPQGTYLLRDIDPGFFEGLNPTPAGSDPDGFTVFGGRMFFAASEQGAQTFSSTIGSGRELWSSDGTVAGTALFKDINPGRVPVNSTDSSDPQALTVFNGRLWFVANDGTNGKRWWTSDGTPAGTVRWPDSPVVNPGFEAKPAAIVIGPTLFFINNSGSELWRTDGTAAGTARIYARAIPSPLSVFFKLIPAGPKLYLLGFTGSRYELWTTDGTEAGTLLLRSIAAASTTLGVPDIAALGSRVVFTSESATEGREAWVSDGTVAGTQLLRDLWPGPANASGIVPSGFPRGFASLGDRVVFGGLSPTAGEEPWITDGTTAGTQVLADLAVTAWTSRNSSLPPGSSPDNFIADSSQAWWVAGDDGRRLGRELWRWDRNREPYCVRDLTPLYVNRTLGGSFTPYNGPGNSSPLRLFGAGERLYFRALDPLYGNELFVSDGTAPGTRRLRNLSAGTVNPASLTRADEVVVAGFDGINARLLASGSGGIRRWASDHGRAHGAPQHLVEFSGGIAFSQPMRGAANVVTQQIFRWPDSAPAPLPVMSFTTVWRMAAHGPWIWMAGIETDGTRALWRTDGTTTERVTTLMSGNLASLTLQEFLPDGTRVFFTAGVTEDRELWISDPAGTRRISPAAGAGLTITGGLIRFDGKCYFTAVQSPGYKVWSTDGTAAGTAPLREGTLSADWILPTRRPIVVNGRLLFSATPIVDPPPSSDTLWSTDGTTAGTVELLTGSNPGPPTYTAQEPRNLTVAGTRVFFSAVTRGFTGVGEELWFTDGTPAGTRFVSNIQPRPVGEILDPGSIPRLLTAIGPNVVFTAGIVTEGRELWFSDGTEAGTRLVRALRPNVNGPVIESMLNFGGRVYFAAHTAESGRELWYSDGTAEGTKLADDLVPGPASADPRLLGAAGGKLHYLAHDGGDDRALRTLSGPPSDYVAWLGSFGRPEGFDSLPAADGDGDSWPNEWENWFGTSPVDPGHAPGLTITGSQPAPGGGSFLTVRYRRPVNWRDRNLVFGFSGSTDLQQWTSLESTEEGVEPGGGFELVTARLRVGAAAVPRTFARLRVTVR